MSGLSNFSRILLPALHLLREMPLMSFALGCLVAWTTIIALRLATISRAPLLRRLAIAPGALVLLLYVALSLLSLHCFLIQGDEANILSIAASTHHGLPMYNPPRSLDSSVSLMYGPATFFIYRAALVLGGVNHFWLIRAFVVSANLGWLAILYLLLRRFIPAALALPLLALPAAILLQHSESALGLRSDIWVTLFAAAALLAAFLQVDLIALALTGLLCGVLVNLKISAAPAVLFPLLVLYRRFGLRPLYTTVPIAAVVALAPFTLADVSLRNYLAWVTFTRSEGLSHLFLLLNFIFALFLIAPLLILEASLRRHRPPFRHRLPELLVILLCLVLAVSTSKPGSGPWYFWHIVPSVVVYLGLVLKDTQPNLATAPVYCIAVGCALLAAVNLPRSYGFIRSAFNTPATSAQQQALNRFLDIYRGHSSIQMADGSVPEAEATRLRYILIYSGQPYSIDGNTGRFETMLLPFPIHVLDRMQHCTDDVWLVPHAQQPFQVYLFPPTLHETFIQNYRIDQSDDIYDAWVCNRHQPH